MTWFYYALLAAAAITVYSLVVRLFLKDGGDAQAFALAIDVVVGLVLATLILFTETFAHLGPLEVGLILLASGVDAAATVLFIEGRQLEEVSAVSIVRQTATVWAFVGGIFVLGESFSLSKMLGITLILAGTVVAFWEREHLKLSKGIKFIFAGAILASMAALIGKTIINDDLSPAAYGAVLSLLGAVWIGAFLPDRRRRVVDEVRLQFKSIVIVGVLLAVGFFFLLKGYQVGEVSKVAPVYNSSLILTVLAGIVLLGERDNTKRKILGAAIAFTGVLILRLF